MGPYVSNKLQGGGRGHGCLAVRLSKQAGSDIGLDCASREGGPSLAWGSHLIWKVPADTQLTLLLISDLGGWTWLPLRLLGAGGALSLLSLPLHPFSLWEL